MALLRIKYWSSLFIITEKNDAYTMVLCCVVCKYRFVKDDGVKSHRFPPDERERKIWLRACHLTHVSDYDRICGKHFRQHEYKSAGSNRLKEGVVPRFSCNGTGGMTQNQEKERRQKIDRLTLRHFRYPMILYFRMTCFLQLQRKWGNYRQVQPKMHWNRKIWNWKRKSKP